MSRSRARLSDENDFDENSAIDLNAVAERIAESEAAGDIAELDFNTPPNSVQKRKTRTIRFNA